MDQGNDIAQARRELEGQFGVHQNAEQLVQAARAARDPLAAAAALKPIDPEATADLNLDDIDVPKGHTVMSAAVRGNAVSFVAADENGTFYKGAVPVSGSRSVAAESPSQASARAFDAEQVRQRTELADRVAELEAELAAERAKKMEALGEDLRKEAEAHGDDAKKAAETAEKQQKEAQDASGAGELAGPNDPAQSSGPKQAEGPKSSTKSGSSRKSGGSRKSGSTRRS